MPKVPSSDARVPLTSVPPAFGWLCDNALHRFWVRNNPRWPTDQEPLRSVWEIAWLLLDLASAPANNLPSFQGFDAWPPQLVATLRADSLVPALSVEVWRELRSAREAAVFARLASQPQRASALPHEELALEMRHALAALGCEALSRWISAEVINQLEVLLAATLWAVATRPSERAPRAVAATEVTFLIDRALEHLRALNPAIGPRQIPRLREFEHEILAFGTRHPSRNTEPGLPAAPQNVGPQPAAAGDVDPMLRNTGMALPPVAPEPERHTGAHAALPAEPASKAVRLGDEVQFTVFRPNQLAPERWSKLLAFAHLTHRRPDAPPGTPDPIAQVEEQARALLGSDRPVYRQLSEDAGQPIPFEGQLTFIPEVPGVKFDPARASVLWVDDVQRVEFRMRPEAQLAGNIARGQLSVFCGSILVAELQLSLRVAANPEADTHVMAPPESTRMYRKIFASYSHNDANIVAQFRELARAFGDRYLIDVSDLRAGERWSEGLEQLIREADVFQLFWSWSSMRSEFVRREWEYALQLGRPSFVRPTYWEQPMPAVPSEGLPPPELATLHFHALAALQTPPLSAAVPVPAPALAQPPLTASAGRDVYAAAREEQLTAALGDEPDQDLARGISTPARRAWLKRIAPITSVVALGAVLLFVQQSGVLSPMSQKPPSSQTVSPEPTPHDAVAAPVSSVPIDEPHPAAPTVYIDRPLPAPPDHAAAPDPDVPVVPPFPRFRSVTEAKHALAAKKIGKAEFVAAMHELDTLRTQRIALEQRKLKERTLSKRAYQKQIEAIDAELGY